MPFSLKHVNYILAVERTGSVTAAANQLFISQPALSQVIRQVERELGVPIFDRSSSPMRLTAAGQEYIHAAQQVVAIHTNLTNRISEIKGEAHGTLRLGISVQRGMQILPRVLPEFMGRYPHVRVELEEFGSNTLEKMVLDGSCDLALITTTPSNSRLRYQLIENEEILLIAARNTQLARSIPNGTPLHIAQAKEERFISLAVGHSIRTVQDRLFLLSGIQPEILLESHNFEACRRLTLALGAVMLCPDAYISRVPDLDLSEKLNAYPLLDGDMMRHFYLCCRRDMHLTRYMEDFLTILRQCLAHS